MFDIGFWELLLIFIVTLLVVGPERLPGLARAAGLWMGKARSFVRNVKADIDHQLATEELQRTLKQQANMPELDEIIEETRDLTADLGLDKPVGTAASKALEKPDD